LQPFALFVTVTVYVPLAVTVGLAVFPPETIPVPAQLNDTPPVEELADRTTDVVVQVSSPPEALTPGASPVPVTGAVAVLVQPLAEHVTVTVYVPVALTLGFAELPPETIPGPDQLNAAHDPLAADRTTDVVEQVSVPPVALAPGTSLFSFTDAVAVLVQPLAEFVTVSVYVPLAHTVGFWAAELKPGPAQLKLVPLVVAPDITMHVDAQVNVPPVALAPGACLS
jgi:hypothetical protein